MAGPATLARLAGAARQTPLPGFGTRVEVDLDRQERESWSLPYSAWLPWASDFSGGVAFHGYADVPSYPASHGCIRVPLAEAQTVDAFARVGVPVRVVA